MSLVIGKDVPWNASWSAEAPRYEIRPCRYAGGRLAVWQAHKPGEGRPLFASPHMVRQRRSIAERRCTVCGEPVDWTNASWFPFGRWYPEGYWASTESPVHHECAALALETCPHIRENGFKPIRFPGGASITCGIVGGEKFEKDFAIKTNQRTVVGHLFLGWSEPSFID